MYLDIVKQDLPIGLWGMDDTTGTKDLSSLGNDLTLTGVHTKKLPLVPDAGYSVGFSAGSTAVIPLNTYSVDRPSTVEFWMKASRQASAVLSRGTDGIFLDSNGIFLTREDEVHRADISEWNKRLYIVITVDDSVSIYVNGERRYSDVTDASFTQTTPLVLGGGVFDIDALAIYNRILSEDSIASHWNAGQEFALTSEVVRVFGGECITLADENAVLADEFTYSDDWSEGELDNVLTDGGLSIQTPPDLYVDGTPAFRPSRNLLTQTDSMLTSIGDWIIDNRLWEIEGDGLFGSNVLHLYPANDESTIALRNDAVFDSQTYVSLYVQLVLGSIDDLSLEGDAATIVEEYGDWYRLITQSDHITLVNNNPLNTELLITAPQAELSVATAFTAGGRTAAVAVVQLS